MADIWDQLNDRQRAYLQAVYEADQHEESWRRQAAAKGHWSRTPASEWRWIMYGPVAPPSALYMTLREAKLVDPGTGATWQALETRKVVMCRYTKDSLGVELLEVQITKLGRKVVRDATGEPRPKKQAKGTLRERQWACLVRLYQAGAAGVLNDDLLYGRGGFDWYQTVRRLTDYTPEPLAMYADGEWREGFYHRHRAVYRITAAGRFYYEQERERYQELYPDVHIPLSE